MNWVMHTLDSLFTQAGIKAGTSIPVAAAILLFGENLVLLFVLTLFICADFITGVARAIHNGSFSSEGLKRGALKLVIYILLIMLSNQFARVSDWLKWFDDAIYCYMVLTEYESIAENVAAFGIDWPSIRQLRNIIINLRSSENNRGS